MPQFTAKTRGKIVNVVCEQRIQRKKNHIEHKNAYATQPHTWLRAVGPGEAWHAVARAVEASPRVVRAGHLNLTSGTSVARGTNASAVVTTGDQTKTLIRNKQTCPARTHAPDAVWATYGSVASGASETRVTDALPSGWIAAGTHHIT